MDIHQWCTEDMDHWPTTAIEQGPRTSAQPPTTPTTTIPSYKRDRRGGDKYYDIMKIIEIWIGIQTERHDMIDMINMMNIKNTVRYLYDTKNSVTLTTKSGNIEIPWHIMIWKWDNHCYQQRAVSSTTNILCHMWICTQLRSEFVQSTYWSQLAYAVTIILPHILMSSLYLCSHFITSQSWVTQSALHSLTSKMPQTEWFRGEILYFWVNRHT